MRTPSSSPAARLHINGRATLSYMAPALAALCLAACGGGGGVDAGTSPMSSTATSSSASAAVGSTLATANTGSAHGSAPVPTAAKTAQAGSSLTAQPNTHYEVNAAGAGMVDVTLPTTHLLKVGDVVSVRGAGSSAWRLVPGFSETVTARGRTQPFYLSTEALPGNNAPGRTWTPRLDAKAWQAVATEAEGSVMVAADGAGQLYLSTDAGHTWTAGNSPAANWVAVSASRMTWSNPSGAAGQVQLAAAAQGGGLYRSSGNGEWSAVTSAAGHDLSNRDWAAIDISEGGTITAAVFNGPIYGGSALQPATNEAGAPLVRGWRGLARGNGLLAAVNEEGEVHVSTDGGLSFTQRSVTVGGAAVVRPWSRVAVSRDGQTIAVAGRNGSGLYLSRDAGLSWTRTAAPAGDYAALALSADGQVIGAALGGAGGAVQLSTDGGTSFSAATVAGGNGDWRGLAVSDDGRQWVAAGRGTGGTGTLATSLGDRTAYASGRGAISGAGGDFVEAQYLGNMRWQVRQSSNGPFGIR